MWAQLRVGPAIVDTWRRTVGGCGFVSNGDECNGTINSGDCGDLARLAARLEYQEYMGAVRESVGYVTV